MRVVQTEAEDTQWGALTLAEREFYKKRPGQTDYTGDLRTTLARKLILEVRELYGLPRISFVKAKQPYSKFAAWVVVDADESGRVHSAQMTFPGTNPVCAQNILHELAHVIVDHRYGYSKKQSHGREFVGVMAYLFQYYNVIPFDAFRVILRRHGVKYVNPELCSPDAFRSGA